jgi:hypothetical protein
VAAEAEAKPEAKAKAMAEADAAATAATAATAAEPTALPQGWEEKDDGYGNYYYFDHNTGTSTWDDPRHHMQQAAQAQQTAVAEPDVAAEPVVEAAPAAASFFDSSGVGSAADTFTSAADTFASAADTFGTAESASSSTTAAQTLMAPSVVPTVATTAGSGTTASLTALPKQSPNSPLASYSPNGSSLFASATTNLKLVYEGDRNADGLPHGKGVMVYSDSTRFDGAWVDGKCHGEGTQTFPSGSVFKGAFNNDEKDGQVSVEPWFIHF